MIDSAEIAQLGVTESPKIGFVTIIFLTRHQMQSYTIRMLPISPMVIKTDTNPLSPNSDKHLILLTLLLLDQTYRP